MEDNTRRKTRGFSFNVSLLLIWRSAESRCQRQAFGEAHCSRRQRKLLRKATKGSLFLSRHFTQKKQLSQSVTDWLIAQCLIRRVKAYLERHLLAPPICRLSSRARFQAPVFQDTSEQAKKTEYFNKISTLTTSSFSFLIARPTTL